MSKTDGAFPHSRGVRTAGVSYISYPVPMRVNMHEAKSNLSRLVAAIEAGEADEIEIARAGKTVARLVPPLPRPTRQPGRLSGRMRIGEDFDAPLPADILGAFDAPP